MDSIVTFLRRFRVPPGSCMLRNVEYHDENWQAWTSERVGLITREAGVLLSDKDCISFDFRCSCWLGDGRGCSVVCCALCYSSSVAVLVAVVLWWWSVVVVVGGGSLWW